MDKLFLIDGHALIFKMYYAFLRRPMVNSKGADTSILYGFTKYLLELIRREQPTHLAVMFDPPAKTFRHELSPQYKATRAAAPELVKQALEPLSDIVAALNIPVLMKPGFEADDVIGTIAARFASDTMDVYMVTPDKDLGQMIDNHVFQYKPGKSGSENEILTKESVCEKYGISDPKQIIDILAIWGDAADNVKGIDGVGEIGAKKLVSKYGSMEEILARKNELSPKLRDSIEKAQDHLALSKQLVTIRTDVDIACTKDNLRIGNPDLGKIKALFELYEFNSLTSLLPEGASVVLETKKALETVEIDSAKLIELAKARSIVTIKVAGSSVILASGPNYAKVSFQQAKELLENEAIAKAGYSLKEEMNSLRQFGISLKGELLDAELMHYLLDPERSHKIETLASIYLDAVLHSEEQQAGGLLFDFDDKAAVRECVALSQIVPSIAGDLEKSNMMDLYRRVEMPLIEVLSDMECTGVKVDVMQLKAYSATLSGELASIEEEARAIAGEPQLNLSSPKQVGIVIYEKFGLNPKVRKSRNDSYPTDEESLRELHHPFVEKLLEFRALKKLISTYLDPLPALINPASGKIHTTFNQALTATGRLSSSKPNLQNIPIRSEKGMKIREAFIASDPEGCIVSADYSQIELRVMAHLSKDEGLVEGFLEGADVHRATAARIFHKKQEDVTAVERSRAKVANFGVIYGISTFGLAQRMGISRSESKAFIEEYFASYPQVGNYIDNAVSKAKEKSYVETLFGRKRFLPNINSRNQVVRSLDERNAVNAPIQGTAADIIKLAMIAVHRRIKEAGLKSRMILQVHDELVFDVAAGERDTIMEIVKKEMESVCTLAVPLSVECNYGKNWKEAH